MKEYKSFWKNVGGNEGSKCRYSARLDTYGCGCAHDCSYCYAKSLLDFRGLWHPNDPAVADIDKIRRKIKRLPKGIRIVRLGGMTDCFQPMEYSHETTYETIKALNEAGIGYLIVTKSAMVARDKYVDILNKDLAHIQIIITSTDDEAAKKYEHCSTTTDRILAIEKLERLGFDVCVRLSPFIPQYVDFEKLGKIRCRKLLVEFLRVNSWIQKWFDLDYSEYTVKQGGYRHLPLEKKLEYIGMLPDFEQISVCEDEDEAYTYWHDHFNPNPDDCCNLRLKV